MTERIMQFIKYLGVSVSEFERNCKLSNGTVSKMGDNTRTSTLDKISSMYPQLNIAWLRTGEGNMLKHTDKIHQQQNGGSHNMQTINTSFPDLSYLIGRIDDIRRYIEILQAQIEHRDKHMSLLLEELAAQRRIIEKKDEQIETLTKKKL